MRKRGRIKEHRYLQNVAKIWHKGLDKLNLSLAGLDARLSRRYQTLVKQHMIPADPLACTIKDLATTQAVWRFLNNERVLPLSSHWPA